MASCTPGIKTVVNDIVKSGQDTRLYRGLVLENDMKVLLVSDPDTDKAAAALDVNIGYMNDPKDLPGLAHFCEHMLFLGTKKYPSENEYTEFLNHHAGYSNAMTTANHTQYHFDVAADHLEGALDRFSQFFIGPLFSPDASDREVNAVDSEHEKNIHSDVWRLSQIMHMTGDPDHPYNSFGSGNRLTLDTLPKSKNIDVHAELLKFHSSYYSSNLMGLSVVGKDSLDDLSEMVVRMFSPVKNLDIKPLIIERPPFRAEDLKCEIHVTPVKDVRTLTLGFVMPDLLDYYRSGPEHYVAHLVGHEAEGSLLSYLRNRGWCNRLVAGPYGCPRGFDYFYIDVDLTEEGLEHTDDIVAAMFQYVNLIRKEGPKEWIFKETSDLQAMLFRFKDMERPLSLACTVTGMMHDFKLEEVLSVGAVLDQYRPDLIELVLNCLVPEKLRLTVVSKQFEGKTDRKEQFYGAEYSIAPISEERLQAWSAVEPSKELALPARNEFIPADFDVQPREPEPSDYPFLVRNTRLSRIWFKQDNTFLLPKMCISLQIKTPRVYQDPVHASLATLFVELLQDALTEFSYNAELAGLTYKVKNSLYGINVRVEGYSHKLCILLERILQRMVKLEVEPQRFEIYKDLLNRALQNFAANQPTQHAQHHLSRSMESKFWSNDEMLSSIRGVTFEAFQEFCGRIFSQCSVEGLLVGNLTKDTALEIADMTERNLQEGAGACPLTEAQLERCRHVELPAGCHFHFEATNKVHDSVCVAIYYQMGVEDTRTNMLLEIFCQIIDEPFFNRLRTQQQLGYIVSSGPRRSCGCQGLRVIVQSEKNADFVERCAEQFLRSCDELLVELSDEAFAKQVHGLTVRRLEKPKKLSEEFGRYLYEIVDGHYNFGRDNIEVACLKTLTKQDVIDFYRQYFAPSAKERRKFTIHILPKEGEAVADGTKSTNQTSDDLPDGRSLPPPEGITDISEFKSKRGLYPEVKPFIAIPPATD